MKKNSARILIAKTGLDGHWRGASLVSRALSDAGFDVLMMGMITTDEIVKHALDADIDLLGISIGGHADVAEKAIVEARKLRPGLPVFVGGVVPPWAKRKLEAMGVEVYPPGSQLDDIVDAAARLTGYMPPASKAPISQD
jgi:methylmalonyl-CoA mutase C-terminal domain/subunit